MRSTWNPSKAKEFFLRINLREDSAQAKNGDINLIELTNKIY